MKRSVHKAYELGELSPITKKGQPVFSRVRLELDPEDPANPWEVTYTPDATDAVKVLRFLDEQNGIGWTPELKRIERELRDALHDLMTVEAITKENE